ncbi:TolB family protein [Caldanaerobacter subterraneus]|uniref:Periplasmic component of the Tol biopolymer transport system n=1 Tax=Caldanaerobacter subterraneus TaxID=911092 RepID=A0A7Y2L998_9THEO|nr:PD40 domain-containing protein [Caldanaerobacter subterraneus]NNG68159.1 hypothetical protein [Caldanaerobacter subterraneus]
MAKKKLIIAIAGLAIVGLIAVPLLASGCKWTYLGPDDYQLAAIIDGTPVIFNALQDTTDKEAKSGVMTESSVEIGGEKNTQITMRWEDNRPENVPHLTFKKITPQNTLIDLQKEVFEVTFKLPGEGTKVWVWDDKQQTYVLSHTEEETYKVKVAKLFVDGKTVFLSANPEETPLFITPEKDKFWYFTKKGFWLIDFNGNAKKLSQDKFNGKTYDELQEELITKTGDSNATLWWSDNPIFSPDGTKVVYMTNRDCIDSGGSSLWLYDLTVGEELPLVKNIKGEHYKAIGWLDSSHILYVVYYTNEKNEYYISDISGRYEKLNLEGKQPYVLGIYPDLQILYTSDYSASRDICLGKVDLVTKAVKEVYKKTLDGVLRNSCGLNPNGSRLAFMYAPDSNGTLQYLTVVNLANKKEILIKRAPLSEELRTVLNSFEWLDNTRLLIRVTNVVDGTNQISSWIFDS